MVVRGCWWSGIGCSVAGLWGCIIWVIRSSCWGFQPIPWMILMGVPVVRVCPMWGVRVRWEPSLGGGPRLKCLRNVLEACCGVYSFPSWWWRMAWASRVVM